MFDLNPRSKRLPLPFARCTFGRKLERLIFSSAFLLTVLTLSSCGSKLTAAHLAKVEFGMSAGQVQELLGKPDDIHQEKVLGFTGTTLTYHAKSSDVKIKLVNDQVVATTGQVDSN